MKFKYIKSVSMKPPIEFKQPKNREFKNMLKSS